MTQAPVSRLAGRSSVRWVILGLLFLASFVAYVLRTNMFAKFSPDGRRVGYVREFNLYVEDLASGKITQLTSDGSRTVINGTFDWVYEEELDDRDGWRWSPDGKSIAFWQLVADSVRDFNLIDYTDSLYSKVVPIQYPKAGESNSAARVAVVGADGGPIRWLEVPGDPRNNYLARMETAGLPLPENRDLSWAGPWLRG